MTDTAPPTSDSIYPETTPLAEQRRAFIFTALASPDIDITMTLKACKEAEAYLETGAAPPAPGTKKLKVVTSEG